MKTIRYIFKKQFILLMILSVFCLKGQAQVEDNLHFNVDWQMNAPISTDFADKISGWGMNFEAGYYVTPRWSLGVFLSFHTNHKCGPPDIAIVADPIADYRPAIVGFPASFRSFHFLPSRT